MMLINKMAPTHKCLRNVWGIKLEEPRKKNKHAQEKFRSRSATQTGKNGEKTQMIFDKLYLRIWYFY